MQKTEASLTEDLFKKFVDAGVRFKKSIPTVFIDRFGLKQEMMKNGTLRSVLLWCFCLGL